MTKDKQIEEMAKLLQLNYDMPYEFAKGLAEFLIDEGYRKASDVAREIFEEIEGNISHIVNHKFIECQRHHEHNSYTQMLQAQISVLRILLNYFAKLKKKYTESEKE